MNQELVTQVEELGLSEKEAKVYIANLLIGPAPVQKIADSAGIKRVTTYVILESLVNMSCGSSLANIRPPLLSYLATSAHQLQ